jgi:hypothetical protein
MPSWSSSAKRRGIVLDMDSSVSPTHGENRKEQAWLATVSESRKAECRAIPSTTPFTDQPADCVRMFFAIPSGRAMAVPSGWETQVRDAPMSIWQAIAKVLPWAGGPPMLVLALGYALSWVFAGFKR